MAAADEAQENSDGRDPSVEAESVLTSVEKKLKLEDLKVSDLKSELEKRELDKSGVKSVLVERLKAAMIEKGEDPAEYCFEIPSNCSSDKTPVTNEKVEKIDANGTIDIKENANTNEEKQEVALQLSIDEEEAQLNEDSLIEITKQSDVANSKAEDSELVKEVCKGENTATDEQSVAPTAENESLEEKQILKTVVPNETTEGNSTVSPKAVKVVGKSDKLKSPTVLAKSLWVTGLPNTTRAADLKALFSKQGRVLSVKIVKSAKQTPGKCYGFVTMATSKDATKAIQNLHRTELNGRVISVEKKQNEPSTLIKKTDSKVLTSTTKKLTLKKEVTTPKKVTSDKKPTAMESKDSSKVENKVDDKKSSEASEKKNEKVSSTEKSKDRKSRERKDRDKDTARLSRRPVGTRPRIFRYNDRSRFSNFRRPFGTRPFSNQVGIGSNFRPRLNPLSFQRTRDDRFQRDRFRERREVERRQFDDLTRHRFIERNQREEAYRLEREKERLRIERELLERERAEIIKLEREKQMLERERLEHERDVLRRQVEMRRGAKRPFGRDPDPLWDERKKPASRYDVRPSLHADVPGNSRFEFPPRDRAGGAGFGREFDRNPDRFNSPKHLEVLPRSDFAERDARREVTLRTREERQIFNRGDFRDRDNRRREPERNSASRRETPRNDWKQDRRVHERVPSGQRRLNYY